MTGDNRECIWFEFSLLPVMAEKMSATILWKMFCLYLIKKVPISRSMMLVGWTIVLTERYNLLCGDSGGLSSIQLWCLRMVWVKNTVKKLISTSVRFEWEIPYLCKKNCLPAYFFVCILHFVISLYILFIANLRLYWLITVVCWSERFLSSIFYTMRLSLNFILFH